LLQTLPLKSLKNGDAEVALPAFLLQVILRDLH